jgi:hypothetical protein
MVPPARLTFFDEPASVVRDSIRTSIFFTTLDLARLVPGPLLALARRIMRPHHSVASLFLVLLVACGDSDAPQSPDANNGADNKADAAPPPGLVSGNCAYDTREGTATISALRTPGPLESACTNDGRAVEFTFVADDPTAPPVRAEWKLVDEGNRRLMTADGKAPASACLTELGISVGAKFRATRRLETGGTCTPVLYAVAVDLKACKARCDR